MLIHKKELPLPIIQGGMGVGVSLGGLAGAVAREGAMGVVSSVNCGYAREEFRKNPLEANRKAFAEEIRKARRISGGNGLVAVNVMVATSNYEEMVRVAVEEGADAVISGAGLPMDLPKYVAGTEVMAAAIVSGGKAARLICKSWDKKYGVVPDFLIIEGFLAGGHLGFKREDIEENRAQTLEEILPEVLAELAPYEEKYGRKIPVFVAGGVFDGRDASHFMKLGASGVQIATRFAATRECDASEGFKEVLLRASAEDVRLVKSPVGMPGRAVESPLTRRLAEGERIASKGCCNCLKVCPKGDKIPYCISDALIAAAKGDYENGLFFCGANVGRIDRIMTVKELVEEIMSV